MRRQKLGLGTFGGSKQASNSRRLIWVVIFCAAAWVFFDSFYPDSTYSNCNLILTESQIQSLVFDEILRRGHGESIAVNGEVPAVTDGSWRIITRVPSSYADAESEYDMTKYEVQAWFGNSGIWALIGPCGEVNLAGLGSLHM